jgi:hypothetical protein
MTSVKTKIDQYSSCVVCGEEFDPAIKRTGYANRCRDCDEPDVERYQGLTVYANKHDRFLTIGKGDSIRVKISQNSRRNFGVITSMVERKN